MELKRNELEKVMGRVVDDSKIINEIVNKIEERYAKDLSDFMLKVEQLLKRERELTNGELEEIVLKIPVFLYFAVQGLETLGVESDMAKAVKEEIAAEVFLKAEGTIPDKTKDGGNGYAEGAHHSGSFCQGLSKAEDVDR